jgi:hypothetical protein
MMEESIDVRVGVGVARFALPRWVTDVSLLRPETLTLDPFDRGAKLLLGLETLMTLSPTQFCNSTY